MKGNTLRASSLALLICLGLACLAPLQAADPASDSKIDLNKAPSEVLETLPGIGPALAGRIVEYREKHGPFRRIEDLMNVRGIGEKNFLKLRDRITVGERKSGKG